MTRDFRVGELVRMWVLVFLSDGILGECNWSPGPSVACPVSLTYSLRCFYPLSSLSVVNYAGLFNALRADIVQL